MKKIEGSSNGVQWILFATRDDIDEARKAAARCMLDTQHTHVRITEVSE